MAAVQTTESFVPSIDWRSIIAGAMTAAALSLVLFGFGSAIGLSLTSARPYAGLSALTMAIVSALWLALVYILTFAAGGYVAGRMRVPLQPSSKEREFRDGAHGFLVWALGTLVGAYMLAAVASATASKSIDAAVGMAEGAGQVSANARENGSTTEFLSYNVDRLLRSGAAPSTPRPVDRLSPQDTAEVSRIFAISLVNGTLAASDREYLVTLVAARAGVPVADAGRRVDEAFAAVTAKKVELEAKVRAAADAARKAGILAAFLAAAVSLAGLVAATWSAACGGRDRDEGRDLAILGQSRLW